MIFGVGTDLVDVTRIEHLLTRYGERFAARILTEEELIEFKHNTRPAHFLARRFAAKEAVVKALGYGFQDGLHWRLIGVGHDPRGRPIVRYYGRAVRLCEELGIVQTHLSLSDEPTHALAFAVLCRTS